MKIIILSDIHANYNALKQLLNHVGDFDYMFCLGDYTGYGTEVNEVINLIKSIKNKICVLGNHDYYVIKGYTREVNKKVVDGINYAKNNITFENIEWLRSLPHQKEFVIARKRFLIQHGSPDNPLEEYIYPDSDKLKKFSNLNYDYIIFGHTHRPMLIELDNTILLNPGSVGQSRHKKSKICAAIINLDKNTVKLIELDCN